MAAGRSSRAGRFAGLPALPAGHAATKDAEALFDRLVSLRNDLGLLAEEYDTKRGRLVGNFPQAFSHLAMIHSASILSNAATT